MRKVIASLASAILLVATPVLALDPTTIQGQINALLAQIKALQDQLAALQGGSTTPLCLDLSYNFGPDDTDATTGGEVTKIQRFLVSHGLMSAALPFGYFGPATMRALQAWQAQKGIVSSGAPDSTGYGFLGPKTRRALACTRQEPVPEQCPIYQAPLCGADETLTFDTDARGCKAPRCTKTITTCPMYDYQRPICRDGEQVVGGGTDERGCQLPPKCVTTKCGVSSFSVGNACPGALGSDSVRYNGARFKCYDGFSGTVDVQDSCMTAESLQQSAERACANRCSADNKPPVISSFSGPTTLKAGEQGTWKIQASDPENGALTYSIDWGEPQPGLSSAALKDALDTPFRQTTTFTHSYANPGTYIVRVSVHDNANQTAQTSSTVRVSSTAIDCTKVPSTTGPESLEWQKVCRPTVCTTEYAPVCGLPATGSNCPAGSICMMVEPFPTTYSNKCMLKAAGATYLYDGACKSQPTTCTSEYTPICGLRPWSCNAPAGAVCNAPSRDSLLTTYDNRCELERAGAEFVRSGACPSTPSVCWAPPHYGDKIAKELGTKESPFGEGESTQTIWSVEGPTTVADASFVCRSGEWKVEGGNLGPQSSTKSVFTANALSGLEAALKGLQSLLTR